MPDGRHEVTVTVPWELIEDDHRDIRRRYASMPLRGFRAGKVPAAAVDRMFGEYILGDLLSGTSRRLCRAALAEKEIEAGSPIEISDGELVADKCLRFKAVFAEMPQFDLPDYTHLGIETADRDSAADAISQRLLELTDLEPHPSLVENEMKFDGSDDAAAAAERVKLLLILKSIARRDGIEIDDSDIGKRIERVARENEVTPQELRRYLASGGGMSRLADSLLAESVFDYLTEIQQ